jgi:hypothetical protein
MVNTKEIKMNYAIRHDKISGDWMVFNVGDSFELESMHKYKRTALSHVKHLEEKAKKRARYIRPQTMVAA